MTGGSSMNFFISDPHLGHKNCLAFDNRPFKTIEEHDESFVNGWNGEVGLDDDVYILGDLSWYNSTKTIEILKRLNGRLHLIKGNHDTTILKNPDLRKLFVEITDYKELYINKDISIVLCHYPIPCFKNHYYGWYHFYGHVHSSFEWNMMENIKRQMIELYDKECRMFNVGAMMPYINYIPRTFEQITVSAD
jgi:calcineurin-like phosphoesterase family protein